MKRSREQFNKEDKIYNKLKQLEELEYSTQEDTTNNEYEKLDIEQATNKEGSFLVNSEDQWGDMVDVFLAESKKRKVDLGKSSQKFAEEIKCSEKNVSLEAIKKCFNFSSQQESVEPNNSLNYVSRNKSFSLASPWLSSVRTSVDFFNLYNDALLLEQEIDKVFASDDYKKIINFLDGLSEDSIFSNISNFSKINLKIDATVDDIFLNLGTFVEEFSSNIRIYKGEPVYIDNLERLNRFMTNGDIFAFYYTNLSEKNKEKLKFFYYFFNVKLNIAKYYINYIEKKNINFNEKGLDYFYNKIFFPAKKNVFFDIANYNILHYLIENIDSIKKQSNKSNIKKNICMSIKEAENRSFISFVSDKSFINDINFINEYKLLDIKPNVLRVMNEKTIKKINLDEEFIFNAIQNGCDYRTIDFIKKQLPRNLNFIKKCIDLNPSLLESFFFGNKFNASKKADRDFLFDKIVANPEFIRYLNLKVISNKEFILNLAYKNLNVLEIIILGGLPLFSGPTLDTSKYKIKLQECINNYKKDFDVIKIICDKKEEGWAMMYLEPNLVSSYLSIRNLSRVFLNSFRNDIAKFNAADHCIDINFSNKEKSLSSLCEDEMDNIISFLSYDDSFSGKIIKTEECISERKANNSLVNSPCSHKESSLNQSKIKVKL